MITKIGKLLIIFLCAFSYSNISLGTSAAKIELKVLSSNGEPLEFVEVGVPFEFQIKVLDSKKRLLDPKIEGLENFQVLQGSTLEKRSIAFDRKASLNQVFSYSLVAQKEGDFYLGPVTFNSDSSIETKKIDIKVKAGDQLSSSKKKNAKKSGINCVFKLLKKEAYIGEKVPFEFECNLASDNLHLTNIVVPDSTDARFIQTKGPKIKKTSKSSANNKAIKLAGYVIPEKAGPMLLTGCRVDYLEEVKAEIFGGFMGIFRSPKTTYSNAEKLEVLDLPTTDKLISGVGNFKNFKINLSKSEIAMNSGVALTLSVESDCDLESIKAPVLNLPDHLKSYSSKTWNTDKQPFGTKNFEFIIQGLKEGTYTIPAQELTYFDPVEKKYETLKTKPIELKILPPEKPDLKKDHEQEQEVTQDVENLENFDALSQSSNYNFPNSDAFRIPWFFFAILVFGPILFSILNFFYCYFMNQKSKYSNFVLNKRVLKKLSKELLHLKNSNKYDLIYNKFKSSLSLFLTGTRLDLTDDEIIDHLIKFKFDTETVSEFKTLMGKLLLLTDFSTKKLNKIESAEICDQAEKFIEKLQISSYKINKLACLFIFLLSSFTLFAVQLARSEDSKEPDLVTSIVLLKKAQKFKPLNERAKIEKIINKIKNKSDTLENKSVFDYIYFAVFHVPILIWQLIFIFALSVLIFFRNLLSNYQKIILISALALSGLGVAIFAYEDLTQYAIVSEKNVMAHIGPESLYPVKNGLDYLDDVKIIRKQNSWYYISATGRAHNVIYGWVEAKNIRLI